MEALGRRLFVAGAIVLLVGVAGCVVDTGPRAFYETGCFDNTDCVPGATCYSLESGFASDTMCSTACSSDLDCGSNGWCVQQNAATPICFEDCTSNADCDVGWGCRRIQDFGTGDSVPACIPEWF